MFRKRITPAVTAALEDEPLPRRRLRTRHRVMVGLGVILFLVGLRLWWGWHAQRRLDRAIAELRASGEPVTEQDVAVPVPDEQNAAFYLRRAAAAYRITRQQEDDQARNDFSFYLV